MDPWFNSDRAKRTAKWIIKDAKRREGGIYVLHDGLVISQMPRSATDSPGRCWIPNVVKEVLRELTAAGFQFPDPWEVFQV
jgi:hypothetical protein